MTLPEPGELHYFLARKREIRHAEKGYVYDIDDADWVNAFSSFRLECLRRLIRVRPAAIVEESKPKGGKE